MTAPVLEPAYVYRATTAAVHDGDTYHLLIDLGFRVSIEQTVRLHGCDTPELNTAKGKEARDYVRAMLQPPDAPQPLLVRSYKDRQSFARWVCDVWVLGGTAAERTSIDLAAHLVTHGFAVPMER